MKTLNTAIWNKIRPFNIDSADNKHKLQIFVQNIEDRELEFVVVF